MATFEFTTADGKPFTLKGPEGLTREQAEAIFKKQDSTGSLVGFKPGDALSAATQAADGLKSAQAMLQQAQSGIAGALGKVGSVASLGSVSTALGAAGGALGGSLAATAAGLTGAVGPAVSAATGAVSSIAGAAQAGGALVQSAIVQGSTAVSAIQNINSAITSLPVTNPINTADFTKVASSIGSLGAISKIGPMSIPEVNGALATAKNLVGQASNVLSNAKGLGSFGLDIAQLEKAGYVKPGLRALAEKGSSLLTAVAKSPAAWTGKDGIKSATDLLASAGKQSKIQQDLMTKGVAALGAVGVPVKNLSSQGIAGMALNAAKSIPGAEAFAKGLPIPGDAAGKLQSAFGSAVRDGAFAIALVNTKIPTAFKEQDIPIPKSNTVNRDTLDAASSRIVGDPKIPTPSYSTKPASLTAQDYLDKAVAFVNEWVVPALQKLQALDPKFAALENQQSITQAEYDALNDERNAIRNDYNINGLAKGKEVIAIYNNSLDAEGQKTVKASEYSIAALTERTSAIAAFSNLQKQRLYALSQKIEGRGEGE